jgi:glycosyltransferase involved in cell wall biosynthesis
MHIGFIEDTPLHGGTQIWVTEATRRFIEDGEEVSVLAPTGSWVAEKCAAAGARVVTYDFNKVVSQNDEFKRIWIQGLAPCDVAVTTVHPPRDGFHCSVFGGKCIKAGGLKTVLIPKTGTIVPEYKREFYLPEPDINSAVISITNFTREYLIEHYKIPAGMVHLIYQGTEVDRFTSTEETLREAFKRYPLPENAGPVLGSVGSFEERKGQIILLEAIRDLTANGVPHAHAMLVGDGPDEAMLKAKVKEMGIEQHVTFFPFTSEPNYVFDRIDILTLPSLYKEGLPNVILEAMSMRLPVIASRMAGIPEVVFDGKTGYMTEPGSVSQFVEAVRKIWQDKAACRTMGDNARKLMEEKMDKSRQFEAFREFFHKVSGQ